MSNSTILFVSSIAGGAIWLAAAATLHPIPTSENWANLLLLLAALVIVPLGLRIVVVEDDSSLPAWASWLPLPAAMFLVSSHWCDNGVLAGLLSLPWLAFTGVTALIGIFRIIKHRLASSGSLAVNVGLLYLAVGGGWATMSRFGVRPLGFDDAIVLLTAIHFHYAGFALPLLTGFAAQRTPGLGERLTCVGVIISVPAVAVGITATQLGLSPIIECLAAELMSFSGLLAAGLQLRIVAQGRKPTPARALLLISAVSLAFGMLLSALYGARAFLPVEALDIPWMRALHGTANALGFTMCGLVAWNCCLSTDPQRLH